MGDTLGGEDGGWLETEVDAVVANMGPQALLGRGAGGGLARRGKGRRGSKSDEEGSKKPLAEHGSKHTPYKMVDTQ